MPIPRFLCICLPSPCALYVKKGPRFSRPKHACSLAGVVACACPPLTHVPDSFQIPHVPLRRGGPPQLSSTALAPGVPAVLKNHGGPTAVSWRTPSRQMHHTRKGTHTIICVTCLRRGAQELLGTPRGSPGNTLGTEDTEGWGRQAGTHCLKAGL